MKEMENKIKAVEDEDLSTVAGGASAEYQAALDVLDGKYGVGEDRVRRLTAAGYNYQAVQHLVNGLCRGYGQVARDIIDGRYGNNAARVAALRAAGLDPVMAQDLVNAMLK